MLTFWCASIGLYRILFPQVSFVKQITVHFVLCRPLDFLSGQPSRLVLTAGLTALVAHTLQIVVIGTPFYDINTEVNRMLDSEERRVLEGNGAEEEKEKDLLSVYSYAFFFPLSPALQFWFGLPGSWCCWCFISRWC